MTWASAHGIAMIAASHAHTDLQLPRDEYIDVFAALEALEVEVVAQKLGPLLGLYVAAPDGGPACLLNSGLSEINMRHTLAHELGHHLLGHGTTLDHEARASGRWGEGWPEHEKAAEMFASWFLMPLPAVQAACARVGTYPPASPGDVYRIARWLGTPYATTVRHLAQLKMISRSSMGLWLKAAPAEVVRTLAPDLVLPAGAHLHLLGPGAHGGHLYAGPGDVLRIDFPGAWNSVAEGLVFPDPSTLQGQLAWPEPTGRDLQLTQDCTSTQTLTATCRNEVFRLTVHPTAHRQGSSSFWPQ